MDAASLPSVGSFPLTIELLCSQLCSGVLFLQLELFNLQLELFAYNGILMSRPSKAWWEFRPRKKYLAPPPPQKFPQTPPDTSAPLPLLGDLPSHGTFNKKTDPRPFLAPQTPLSPLPSRKKISESFFSNFSLRSCRSSSVIFFDFWEGSLAGILRDFFWPTK